MIKKTLIAIAAASFAASSATAGASDLDFRLDNRFTLGAAWRVESRDPDLVGIGNGGRANSTNGDDGNLAFDAGDVVSSAAKLTSDLTLTKGDFGLFMRGNYVFNQTLNDFEPFNADNYYVPGAIDPGVGLTPTGRPSEVPISVYRERTHRVRDVVGNDADLLDAYVFGSLPVGRRDLSFKLGRQVVNWGESTFVLNGINSMIVLDANQARVPGAELDEIFIPSAMAWFSMTLMEGLSAEAFYQFDWQHSEIDAAGTYLSTNDFATIGGQRANITFGLPPENYPNTTIPRAPNREPGSDGQYGVKLSTLVSALNDMDLSLYAMNYHSRLPVVSGTSKNSYAAPSTTGTYFLEYPEDIQLYGLSFNTVVGDWSVQGEYSYKVDQPLQIDDVEVLLAGVGLPSQVTPSPALPLGSALGNKYIRGWRRHDVSQVDVGLTRLMGPLQWTGWDQLILVAEAAAVYVHDLPSEGTLRYDGPGTYNPGDPAVAALVSASTLPALGYAVPVQNGGYATAFSWGYKIAARASYNNVFGFLRLEPTLKFDHDVAGVTPSPIVNFVENRKQVSARMVVHYLQSWTAETGYSMYFGGGAGNLLADRDFVDVVLKYNF
ncbi:DUF1302 domain-containing protein [Sinimarinibacterium sp. CAU 1509]|uniref:DUF1302 domain-containing protein n=1 Tax=Sinimarinibacterium sp. CAU 1509 TaxID=2562283 RepID=UPI0010AC8FCF|nr:DUF1302 domain-containing protein [Sinimarinibacterium sp. CAU 1509]TJY65053.1 DUF1302 domain-containing protein [Sinimarinibacterium sp. CAU 1509]